jgi:3-methyladenine DNA glycosylase AlkD
MEATEAIRELERRGTEQNRKVYRRHGADANLFGVSYADLKILKKSIKVDQRLAEALWLTGNHDARVLATMIADPAAIADERLDAWAADLTNYVLSGALAGLAARSPGAESLMSRWMASEGEWTRAAGWAVLSSLAKDRGDLGDAFFLGHLATIEREIHSAQNRVRHEMKGALIAIALRNPALRGPALAADGRIGKVDVDHGETGCKTPDVASYVARALQRKG